MKKFIYIIFGILLCSCTKGTSSCTKETIYHTYYGDIDVDTMSIEGTFDGYPYYLVHSSDKDSVEVVPGDGDWRAIDGPIYIYYCPQKDTYYYSSPDNQGRMIFTGYNPEDRSCFNPMNDE